jgi:uncharacterized membrane protein YgdD (TMEM256/DUF423 family)
MTALSDRNRLLSAIAGLAGAAGVAIAAAASHSGDANLAIVSNFLLFHAPVLLILSFLKANRIATLAAYVLILGLLLFCGDLAMRSLAGHSLFPMAAPIGGGTLILAWFLVAGSAFTGRSTS